MRVQAYIHSLKDTKHDRNILGEAKIIKCIGDNCIDDVYVIQREVTHV